MRQTIAVAGTERHPTEDYRVTRRGVVERLADPYLTDHDRWVLRQFARFLEGRVPEPDPRAISTRIAGPLPTRRRRSIL